MILPPFNDNYMAEMRAQVAAAERCKHRRVVLVFDATSPPEVLRRFIWSCHRRRQRIYRRDWLDSWWAALQKFETVVFLWQTSHAGAPSNEWADVAADEAAGSFDVDDVSYEAASYTSVEWTQADGQLACKGVRAWAAPLLRAAARKRLEETATSTQVASSDDLVLPPLRPSRELLAEQLRGARLQIGDEKRFRGHVSSVRAAAFGCPFGCGCACRWVDAAFKCQGAVMKSARAEWADVVQHAWESIGMQLESSNPSRQEWKLLKDRLAGLGGKLRVGSEEEIQLRRMTSGWFKRTGKRELDCESWAKRSVERVRDAGIRLQRLAREASDEFEENLRKELGEARKVSKFAYKWMKRVVDAGPQRAAWLRELRRTLDEATAAIDRELHDGNIGGVEAARRRTRVQNIVAFGRDNCEKKLRPPASEVVALRQWARLAMCCRWRRRVLGRNMQIDEPASRVRGAALAAARGLARRLERADTVTWADIQAREARARAWWRRGGGHISKYVEELDRFEVHAGRRGDAQGRWLVEVVAVSRPEKRRGPQLDVLVRFKGTDPDGSAWADEWREIKLLSNDLKKEARRLEEIRYPAEPRPASRPAGRRVSPRLEPVYEHEEQGEAAAWLRRWADYAAEAAAVAAET